MSCLNVPAEERYAPNPERMSQEEQLRLALRLSAEEAARPTPPTAAKTKPLLHHSHAHNLQQQHKSSGWRCDVCHKLAPSPTSYWCGPCDYDVCENCFTQPSSSKSGTMYHPGRIGAEPNGISRIDGAAIIFAASTTVGYTWETFRNGWSSPLQQVYEALKLFR